MSRVIRISEALYRRLEAYASGFDTPSNVIERILNAHENVPPGSVSMLTEQGDQAAHERAPSGFSTVDISEQDAYIQPATNLEIVYVSGLERYTEEEFKKDLLGKKRAYLKLFYTNGKVEYKPWKALRFNPESGVYNNVRSKNYLRDWEAKGITKIILSVNRADLDHFTD